MGSVSPRRIKVYDIIMLAGLLLVGSLLISTIFSSPLNSAHEKAKAVVGAYPEIFTSQQGFLGMVDGVRVYAIPEEYFGLIEGLTSPPPSQPIRLKAADLAKISDLPQFISVCGVAVPIPKEIPEEVSVYNLTLRQDTAALLFYNSIESALENPDRPILVISISCLSASPSREGEYDPQRVLNSLSNETQFVVEVAKLACGVDLSPAKLVGVNKLNAWALVKPRWEYVPIIWRRGERPGAIYAGCKPGPLAGSVTLIIPCEGLWCEYRVSGWFDADTLLKVAESIGPPGG